MTSAPRAVRPSVNGWNSEYLDAQYQAWKRDPSGTPEDLAQFFRGFDLAYSNGAAAGAPGMVSGSTRASEDRAQSAVSSLIQHYRERGHLCAAIDPFGREREMPASLQPTWHGLSESDLDRTFAAGSLSPDGAPMRLRDIIAHLDDTYCGSVGAEFAYVSDETEWKWLAERMELSRNKPSYAKAKRFHILLQLYRSELFEKFCAKRYPGVKRFSLEGGEVIIPMLDRFVEQAGDDFGVEEIVFAMSHRGRLNVLTNIIGKTYQQIFTEFQDAWAEDASMGGGDVKYHRGYSANRVLPSGKHVWLAMNSNPSHLEAACAVALGRCRAKQRLRGDAKRERVLPLLMHGDGAVIGQGVIAEDYNLSQLPGYTVGGTVHLVINNQIGFTTGREEARSSRYCTDIAKMIEAPVLHVNGEDPDACVHAVEMALEYRMMFKKDIVIDVQCYRRHGHNETDEAMFTQPLLYKEIKDKPSVVKSYAERLVAEGVIADADAEQIRVGLDEQLDQAYEAVQKTPVDPNPDPGHLRWDGVRDNRWTFAPVDTAVGRKELEEIAGAMGRWPEGFTPHRKLVKTLQERASVLEAGQTFDWATGELFAVGASVLDGTIVRFSGQDSCRGTFSQRHAVLVDVETGDRYVPLNHIRELGQPGTDKDVGTIDEQGRKRQAKFCIYDSPLSEFSVMGFEYGFSLAAPNMLVMWEAQFGDFANGAQVIIDQFLAAGEAKWQRWSGLVLLLPHGYEGQGPEHSSARLERFLRLCGDNNMIVAYPSTPAQHFHMLRRQVKASYRKPLVVMTPKSLLRLPACRSSADEITGGHFREILGDPAMGSVSARKKVKRVVLCSGKVYYDLDKRRQDTGNDEVAIVRVEQLYPLHTEMLKEVLSEYPKDAELMWVQEEPRNMGAWGHMHLTLRDAWGIDLPCIGRPARGTPATGSPSKHAQEQENILEEAIGSLPAEKKSASKEHAGVH
ncbi:MAG: 2-oxoglutarate dehydrogenase E1 component [Phycisphaerales bacterium]|nr:2-oxoglutarate dehydrogenase E1 component [Phycisphaerales bacterium]